MSTLFLDITYHDPAGRLYELCRRQLPALTTLFDGIAANASASAYGPTLALLASAGADIRQQERPTSGGIVQLGRIRREVLAQALALGATGVFYCDGDRILHWVEHYPDELARVVRQASAHDFTVLGRTPRAFASHPRVQTDTERIINHVFATVSGHTWDITAGARALSRRATQAIIEGCQDDSFGVDATWPLFLMRQGGFSLAEILTEGLEFETAAQHPQEVAAAGGVEPWKQQLDGDPQRWAFRLKLAEIEVAAMAPYR
jgi:hypothetical protein